MRRHHVRGFACRLFSVCAILAPTVVSGLSQTPGQVTGRITDASGAAAATATVTFLNTATNAIRTTISTEDGDYTFSSVPPGMYTVKTERAGFRIAAASRLQVQVQQNVRHGLTLEAGRVTETAGRGRMSIRISA